MRTFISVFLALIGFTAQASADGLSTSGWGPPPPSQWGKNNLHLIHEDRATGFALYRTSKPDAGDMRKFCELGITEMMVLSGTADKHEFKYAKECPSLKVIYNVKQAGEAPVDGAFLDAFDTWVQDAKNAGKKIAFRCECGCHRTGRLAAYYQMKHMQLTLEDAIAILSAHGYWMVLNEHIYKQTIAIYDYIQGAPCSQKPKYCVRTELKLAP